tara:strand:+ start:168 stop:710 length:543 start_codon:yes stop_codon:yes gene_type:complete
MSAETYKIFITEEGVEKVFTREDIVELLYNDVATVTFTKADGTERVMECTLLQEVLNERSPVPEITDSNDDEPPSDWVQSQRPKRQKPNLNTIPVYDIQEDDWRSFRLDSVKSIGFPTTIHTDSGTVLPTFNSEKNSNRDFRETGMAEPIIEAGSIPEDIPTLEALVTPSITKSEKDTLE